MTFTFYIESQVTDVRDLTVNRLKMGTLEILVPYDTSVGVGNSFELKENSTTLLKGKIIRIRDQAIVGVEKKVLTCLDSTHALYEKYCIEYGYHEYFSKDAGWIANDLVDYYFSGILTSVNIDTTTGVTVTRIEFDGKTVGAALEELAKRANCYFYVDNADDVHFFIAESVSSGKTIQGTDLSKIRVTDESIRHINRVIVRGRHRAIQASAGSGYPEEFYQDNRIISLGEAQEVANALKAELDKDRQQTELTLPNFIEVRPGETLVLNSPDRGFDNETLPIQKVKWVFYPTKEKTILVVGDEQPTLNSILAALARGVNWEPSVQIPSGTTFPTDPADETFFKLTQDINDPEGVGVYYAPAYYKYDTTLGDWVRKSIVMHRATQPPDGGEVLGDEWYDTTNNIKYRWNGTSWEQITSLNLVDMPDFEDVEWPTDQLAIEAREWTGNFSLIWDDKDDEPPTDWNHFKWGKKDNEGSGGVDATISYATDPPTTVDVNCGENPDLGDGEWFAYWDTAYKPDGVYDVQWSQDYSDASGKGKGLLAVVQVRNATSESPSVMAYNTYVPQLGVGSFVAHSIYSKHLSGEYFTGKRYRTSGRGETPKTAGVEFDDSGIRGYSGATQKSFELDSITGDMSVLGDGIFKVMTSAGGVYGTFGVTEFLTTVGLYAVNAQQLEIGADLDNGEYKTKIQIGPGNMVLWAEENIVITPGTGDVIVYNGDVLDLSGGGVNPGRLVLPIRELDPPAPRDGEIWVLNP